MIYAAENQIRFSLSKQFQPR